MHSISGLLIELIASLDTGSYWGTQKQLAECLETSERNIRKALEHLLARGFLVKLLRWNPHLRRDTPVFYINWAVTGDALKGPAPRISTRSDAATVPAGSPKPNIAENKPASAPAAQSLRGEVTEWARSYILSNKFLLEGKYVEGSLLSLLPQPEHTEAVCGGLLANNIVMRVLEQLAEEDADSMHVYLDAAISAAISFKAVGTVTRPGGLFRTKCITLSPAVPRKGEAASGTCTGTIEVIAEDQPVDPTDRLSRVIHGVRYVCKDCGADLGYNPVLSTKYAQLAELKKQPHKKRITNASN